MQELSLARWCKALSLVFAAHPSPTVDRHELVTHGIQYVDLHYPGGWELEDGVGIGDALRVLAEEYGIVSDGDSGLLRREYGSELERLRADLEQIQFYPEFPKELRMVERRSYRREKLSALRRRIEELENE